MRKLSGVMLMFYILTGAWVIEVSVLVKTQQMNMICVFHCIYILLQTKQKLHKYRTLANKIHAEVLRRMVLMSEF